MTNDFIFDIETYPNVFTMSVEHADAPLKWAFEISDWQDDSADILAFLAYLKQSNARMVGFNNVGFDYPVLHTLIRMGKGSAEALYDKARAIIDAQDENRWLHMVYPSDRFVPQVDLYLIHHFDNKARSTSLKVLEFNMRAESVADLPFPVGTRLTRDQVMVLKQYNAHDVAMTKRFYHESLPMIRFREELSVKYPGQDWINFNDTKIGKQYFIMELEKAGVPCYQYGPEGRQPRQTKRPQIALRDCILPWIEFQRPEFQRVLDWLKAQTITETKGVFKDLTATVDGFTFVFGTGGIHGSVENRIVGSGPDLIIESVDVASMYPNIAIRNKFYPEHLGERFCVIYENLYLQRKQYAKGTAENAMLKLALNGSYGDSNNPYSPFYDPMMTLRITLTGQLLLCKLAEMLLEVPTVELLMSNTDGCEYSVHPEYAEAAKEKCRAWENMTGLELEHARYKRLFILDCNNYLGEYEA